MHTKKPSVPIIINLSLIAVITAVLVAFGFFDFTQQRDKRYQELHENISTLAEQLGSSLALPLWNFQDDQAAKIVENAMRDSFIVAVIARDTITQRIVAGRTRNADGVLIPAAETPPSENLIFKMSPITFNGRDIGQIEIWGTPEYARAALKESLTHLVLSIALVNAALVALLSLILNRTVIRPLKAVETYALAVSSEEQADAVIPRGFFLREMENLRDSIVIMVDKLRLRYEEVKQSQTGLAKAEAQYRNLYENALAGIFRCTPGGTLLSANSAMARILGYSSPFEMLDAVKDFYTQVLLDASDRQELRFLLDFHDEVSRFRVRFAKPDGEIRIGTLHARITRDERGARVHLDGMIEDITDRTRAEEQLIEAHEFIQNILDSMPSMVIGIDAALRITHFNRTTQTATDIDEGRLLGMPLTEVLPRLTAHTGMIERALREGKPASLTNQAHMVEDHLRQENILIFPIVRGGERGAVIRIDDVTDQARLEQLILQTEKMMSLGGLAAGMAHEINNPLAGILQSVQNISRRISPGLEANSQAAAVAGCSLECIASYLESRGVVEFLANIREAGERAAKIVNNMLSFTHRASVKTIPTRLDELLDRSVDLASTDYDLKKNYDFKQIEIIREYSPDVPPVACVPMEIEQVFINLLRNAAQAMAVCSGTRHQGRISLRLRLEGKMAVVEVEDNGPGIGEKDLRKVFEPFYTTKKPGEGTGLGLSVSFFIITRNHGGTIRVESEPGHGAKFIVQLPVRAELPEPPAIQ